METNFKRILNHFATKAWLTTLALSMFCASIVYIAFFVERYEHFHLFSAFSISFLAYTFICYTSSTSQLKLYLRIAIIIRLILVFSMPSLSDDIYRFIWDGRTMLNGIHPFSMTPEQVMASGQTFHGLDTQLYNKLNSPHYFSIYPTVNQFVFYTSSWLASDNIYLNTILIKLFLFTCELLSLWAGIKLLKYKNLPTKRILWYVLNPLIILEICGNAHFEGAMIAFLALGLLFTFRQKNLYSALGFTLSVASKMLTAMFLPLFALHYLKKKKWKWIAFIIIFMILISIPLMLNFNIINSFDLYFRKFEYNASFYYLFRWIGFQFIGYNLIHYIGPIMAGISISIILVISILKNKQSQWFQSMFWIFVVYLLMSTTVHPWYLSMLLFLGIFNNYRFPYLWSFLIFFSYTNYQYQAFHENLFVVCIEYIAVLIAIFLEIKKPQLHHQ